MINTATNHVTTTIAVGRGPTEVAVSPDGTRAYVTVPRLHTVSVIDTATDQVTATIDISDPEGVAVSPDGTRAYVTSGSSGTVSVIDTATCHRHHPQPQ
ncbi:MAG: YncE family protein [Streptosporangiaceae bacterium]